MRLIPNIEFSVTKDDHRLDTVLRCLADNGYAVLLTEEENLYVINYIYAGGESFVRNGVVFLDRALFEEKFFEKEDGNIGNIGNTDTTLDWVDG